MINNPGMVREVAREIADAAEGAMDAYRGGRVPEEPKITDRILGAIEDRLRAKPVAGIIWTALTLATSRGVAAEESRHGADLLGVLDIDIPRYRIRKGFIAQAKKAEPGVMFASKEWDRLRDQCKTMLERTPEAFVFAYSKARGVRIFPAIAIVASDTRDLFDLYSRSVATFFENHIECFIGDMRLKSPKIETLDALADFPVRKVLHVTAREGQE